MTDFDRVYFSMILHAMAERHPELSPNEVLATGKKCTKHKMYMFEKCVECKKFKMCCGICIKCKECIQNICPYCGGDMCVFKKLCVKHARNFGHVINKV